MDEEGISPRMRLLFVQESDWIKRNPAQQHHLAEMLSLRGHTIRAIDYEILWKTNKQKGLCAKRTVFNGISKIHKNASIAVIRPAMLRVPLLNYVSMILTHRKEIKRQIIEFKPDVIVGWGIINTYLACRAAKKYKIPFLYYWIDVLDSLIDVKAFQALGKSIEKRTLKGSTKVLAINDKLADYVAKLGVKREQVAIIRAGINPGMFHPGIDGTGVRNLYGISDSDCVLFFMGWIYHFAGVKEVAAKMAEYDESVKLIIVGDGDAFEEVKAVVKAKNLGTRVFLTGKKEYSELPEYVAAADACLLPAYPEEKIMQDIVPIKMYEYMAMGKPVISTKLPGVMKEFGTENGVVYIDTPEDAIGKALDLIKIGQIEELGKKANEFVNKCNWDYITDCFESVITQVVQKQ
jgi:glycosyltransferase involved in cell wall biosynthesis